MYQTNQYPNGAYGFSISLLLVLFLITFLLSFVPTIIFDKIGWIGEFVRIMAIILLYPTLVYFGMMSSLFSFSYECNGCTNRPLIAAIAVQTIMLSIVFAVYSRSLIPESIDHPQALELHLTNWWRMTQAILSLSIALGIGLFAQFLISSENIYIVHLIPLIIGLGFGLLAILGFIFWKMNLIERLIDNRQVASSWYT